MLDPSSRLGTPSSGDPLTDMLRGLRLDGVEYGRCRLAVPWGLHFSGRQGPRFHFIAEHPCWLRRPDGAWEELRPGDAVLLPRGSDHALASCPDVPLHAFARDACVAICENVYDYRFAGDGAGSVLFSGTMRFNIDGMHPLLRMMPEVMRAQELMADDPTIAPMLDAMVCEVAMDRVGAGGIAARLADVLAAKIIRSWVEHGGGDATGWLAAVRHPDLGRVLAAIHLQPDRDWSVAALAGIMGASRSRFAESFTTRLGETPARYVAMVRMHLARHWLQQDRARIAEVAARLGYDSEASFSRAFKRIIGMAPSEARRG
ncbi:MAG TPA: AraC family transcriptional regulator [Roseomonas sp.]|jgi:AraC-like DNA-binding protein